MKREARGTASVPVRLWVYKCNALNLPHQVAWGDWDEVFSSQRVVSIKVADRHELGRVQTLYPGRNTTWTLAHDALVERLPVGVLQTGARVVA
jgi:hypothetical protein